MDEDCH
jgi:hypothetical protein